MKTTATTTLAALLMLAACSDSTGPTNGTQVALTFASNVAAGAAAAPGLFSGPMAAPITDGTNTLDITSVKVVLREIELKRVEVTDCDVEPEPDGCEKFELGPIVVELPVDGAVVNSTLDIMIDPGTYTEIEFDIHKVEDSDAVLLGDTSLLDKSIVVVGTYNGDPFTFDTNLSEEQELEFPTPLVIDESTTTTNVTIRFDISTWFKDESGNLFNPATASTGEPNESLAEENIKNSLKAFEDKDRDGDDSDEG